MYKKMLRYLALCMGIYLSLAAIEIFLLRPLIEMITTNFWGQFGIYCVLLLLVDPPLTGMIAMRFDKKEENAIDEDA